MIDAALELASLGWPVFPCVETPGEKAKSPYTKNGFHDASTDPDWIRRCWEHKPDALIGVPVPPWMLVIDIDPRHGGSRNALEEKTGPLPATLAAWSGRGDGGQHLWFFRPAGDLDGKQLKPMGIDLKDGGRGYVIAPPSLHPDSGLPYRWENWEDGPVAVLPYRLHELLKPPAVVTRKFDHLAETGDFSGLLAKVAAVTEGGRNDYLFWAACRLAEKGALDQNEDGLISAALSTGLSEREIQTCIESARRRVRA